MKKVIILFFSIILSTSLFSQAFITTWQSDISFGSDNSIVFPGVGQYEINWVEVGNFSNSGSKTCNGTTEVYFPNSGTYRLSVTGNLQQMRFDNIDSDERREIMSINSWGGISWTSMENAFYGCTNMEYNTSGIPDLSNVSSLAYMFQNCYSVNGNLSNWNTSTITDMSYMFAYAGDFNGSIGQWDVSNVTNMSHMFEGADVFDQAIGFWDVSNVIDMSYMFFGAEAFNQPLGFWNTAQVTNMSHMFAGPNSFNPMAFNQFIGSWDVSAVTDFSNMLQYCSNYDEDMSNWNVSNGLDFSGMFEYCLVYNQDMSNWDVSNGLVFAEMFKECRSYNQDMSNWDMPNATDLNNMFNNARSFNQNLNTWNMSNITDISYMFYNAESFNQPLDLWDTSNMAQMQYAFGQASVFNQNITGWDVSNVVDMEQMFGEASSFNQAIGSWDVSSVINMNSMFSAAIAFNQDIGNWDVSNVASMGGIFYYAIAFNQDIGNWNVSNVTNMTSMFKFAVVFNQDITGWDVSNVLQMGDMFYRADAFNQAIGSWDVSSVINMIGMFHKTVVFNQDLSDWNTSSVESMTHMFYEAEAFDQSLGAWDISNVTSMDFCLYKSNLSVANYDNTIINWATQDVNNYLNVYANDLFYCNSEAARQILEDDYGWDFYNDAKNCTPIVTTWKTDNPGTTTDSQVLIPGIGTSYEISWFNIGAPGINGTVTANGPTIVDFPTSGTYEISISGDFDQLDFFNNSGDRLKILSVEEWGTGNWLAFAGAFYRCENLNINAIDAPNLSTTTSLFGMFEECSSLNADFSHWDFSNITNVSRMLKNASSFDQDLGGWNISNMTNMSQMLDQTALSFENYDNTIIGWSGQTIQSNVSLGASGLEYCESDVERQMLIDNTNWSFSGDAFECPSTDVFVDYTATGANNGTSWTDAFTNLQSALALGGDQHIYVATGSYKPTSGTQRGKSFELSNRVHLYGGYPNGGGTRDVSAHPTTLSGNIDDISNFSGNSFHVVKIADANDVIIDGIVIRDGNANDPSSFGRARGGGLYIKNASVTLENVEMKWNRAVYGGAIFATLSPEVTIQNSLFKKNQADFGAALYHSNETNMYIEYSEITNNTALGRCAIEINNSSYTKIENSLIANNASDNANAIAFIATNRDQSCDIINTTILGETKNKNLITLQIGFNDQMDLNIHNSIVAHQNLTFDKSVQAFNNGTLNFNHSHSYFQGNAVIGNGTSTLFSDIDGDLMLNVDYSVNECSPVVNAGNNVLGTGAEDYFGNPRYFGIIDIGAFEAQVACVAMRGSRRDEELNVSIFPNPVSSEFRVKINRDGRYTVKIYDALSREVFQGNIENESIVNTKDWSSGIYHVVVMSADGKFLKTEKIFKN